jgi:hypothetical protein
MGVKFSFGMLFISETHENLRYDATRHTDRVFLLSSLKMLRWFPGSKLLLSEEQILTTSCISCTVGLQIQIRQIYFKNRKIKFINYAIHCLIRESKFTRRLFQLNYF